MIDPNDQLQEAFDKVSMVHLFHALGYVDMREAAAQKNPWRDDHKAGSFSVQRSYFKDHANDEFKGGHLKCIEFSRPGISKKEAVDLLFEIAGITREKQSTGTMKRIAKEKRSDLYKKQARTLEDLPRLGMEEPGPMSGLVLDCWREGLEAILPMVGKIAESRGWKESELMELINTGKTALPRLPWSSGADNKRGWAWLIEKPIFKGLDAALVPVGFHARYKIYKQGQFVEKRWLYVPYIPQGDRLSDFQSALAKAKVKLPAYPFVLGDLKNPKLVIITEGQFDAVSMAAAFGWIENGVPAGVVIFGLRGVSSPGVFLAAYGAWIKKHAPFVWIMGDNDSAGRKIDEKKADQLNKIVKEPTFIDRLRAQGCKVEFQWLEVEGCKDFNDVWRAYKPSIEQMKSLAAVAGCFEILEEVMG